MVRRAILPALLVGCGLAVSGCGTKTFDGTIFSRQDSPFGVDNLIERESLQTIDLAQLLTRGGVEPLKLPADDPDNLKENIKRLEEAFKTFDGNTDGDKKRLRNQIQERILAASNQACGEFKRELKKFDARWNFVLGSATTALAGAGAIFTGAAAALSGSAAIVSGVRAELNEDYFHTLTIQVITNGFETRRKELYRDILKARNDSSTDYPVQRAIKDAILYHESCSLVAGLEHAALSIERAENPGLKQLNRTLDTFKTTREKLDIVAGRIRLDEPILPLTALLKAEDAKKNLDAITDDLAAAKSTIPDVANLVDPGNSSARKQVYVDLLKGIENAPKDIEKLVASIGDLTKSAKTAIDKKSEIKKLQDEWPGKFTAAQTASAGTKRETAKAELLLQRAKAKEAKETYDNLRHKLEASADKANKLIQTIGKLVKTAEEFLRKPYVDLNGKDADGIDYAATFAIGGKAVPIVDKKHVDVVAESNVNLASVTVTITNVKNAGMEVLKATGTGTDIVSTTGVLELAGSDTRENYVKILKTLTYRNNATAPDKTARKITFIANDGTTAGVTTTTIVTIK